MAIKDQVIEEEYALYNGDCIEVMSKMKDNSIDLSIYSPPFRGLYSYSSNEKDLSNCTTKEQFFEHYTFVVKEIARLTKPGRITAVHCTDIPMLGANIGPYEDFPGDIIRLHQEHGFDYLPRICIWKEPLGVRNRTMLKALAHATIVEDSTKTNVACADYLIPFRRRGENEVPVVHPNGLMRYAGERIIPKELQHLKGYDGKQTENRYSHWIWRQYASCFWDDIRIDRVLPYKESRDPDDERHVHPLQIDVIERCVVLWTNPGEVVLTPFMGVGSEVYGAQINKRRSIGIELKPSFFKQAVKNMEMAEQIEDDGQIDLL
jgi:DNA modification methylase